MARNQTNKKLLNPIIYASNRMTSIIFQIQKSVSSRMEVNYKLEQDDMEGVDEREWEE
jgi:hypothetical protein